MTPEELAEIEARLLAATPGPWHKLAATTERGYGTHVVSLDQPGSDGPEEQVAVWLHGRNVAAGLSGNDADFIAHAPADIARLLAEVRRLSPALAEVRRLSPAARVARWEPGEDDYEGCTVLRDPATDAVLGWYNRFGFGECIWGQHLFPGAKRKIADLATKNGWEVCDGE